MATNAEEALTTGCSSDETSSQAQLVEVFRLLGKRWSGMIIGTLLERPARFRELARTVSGISDSVLNDRLQELMEAGLVERQLADGPSTAVLYQLTAAGEDFRAAFNELRDWSVRNGLG